MTIHDLKQFVDRTVKLRMADGEIAKVKVDLVDEDDEEVIGVLLETSRPERRRQACARCTFSAAGILSAELSG